jgi:hypothetical protein
MRARRVASAPPRWSCFIGIVEDLAARPCLAAAAGIGHDRPSRSTPSSRARGPPGAESAGPTEGVNLMTYHRAKGLEWDAVYLPALDEGTLPIRQAKEADEIAEERRLLYVGITRARTIPGPVVRLAPAVEISGSSTPETGQAADRQGSGRVRVLLPGRPCPSPRPRTSACSKPSAAGAASGQPRTACPPTSSSTTPR